MSRNVGIPGLLEVPREEGIVGMRYALWDVSGWHRDYSPPVWRNRAAEKPTGWRIGSGKIMATVLREARERQVEEAMESLGQVPEGCCASSSE